MESVIRKWGNSPALRLPPAVIKLANFAPGQKVTITVTRGRIVIEAAEHIEYTLSDLVKGITSRNSHAEVSVGKPVGWEPL